MKKIKLNASIIEELRTQALATRNNLKRRKQDHIMMPRAAVISICERVAGLCAALQAIQQIVDNE